MNSIWLENVERPSFPALTKDIKTGVLIIGGGISGILTAHFLQERNVPYVLVEKDRICGGTTGNTTAKITVQHSLIYHKILRSIGVQNAQLYLQANQTAFDKFTELCRDIDCNYERRDNFVYSLSDRKKLFDEINTLERIGYNAKLCEKLPLPIETAGAV